MTRRTCPYLDYRPPQNGERTLVAEAPWLSAGLEEKIIRHAISSIVPPNVEEVRARRLPQIGNMESEISAPLRKEINYWDHRAERLKSQERAGRHTRLPPAQAAARANDLADRLQRRLTELARERDMPALPPQVGGGAIIVPAGLLTRMTPCADFGREPTPDGRAKVERLSMAGNSGDRCHRGAVRRRNRTSGIKRMQEVSEHDHRAWTPSRDDR